MAVLIQWYEPGLIEPHWFIVTERTGKRCPIFLSTPWVLSEVARILVWVEKEVHGLMGYRSNKPNWHLEILDQQWLHIQVDQQSQRKRCAVPINSTGSPIRKWFQWYGTLILIDFEELNYWVGHCLQPQSMGHSPMLAALGRRLSSPQR